jgi:hypothetical protein
VDGTGVNVWLVGAVTPAEAQRVSSGTKYAAFKIMINHQKSNGPGSCSGCETPMCIKLEAITLCNLGRVVDENSNKMESLTWEVTQGISGMGGASQIATWQGGTPNCAAGMAKPSTWSELKARFRSK